MGFALSKITLTSTAFQGHAAIPKKHTGEGQDVSPALAWRDAPAETKAFAVICHDPDAPLIKNASYGYVHWVLYNLPASLSELAEGTREGTLGTNDFDKCSYGGPMPPPGHGRHQYYFWILALDSDAAYEPGLSLPKFLEQAEPHIIGMNRLIGHYER